MRECTKCKEIKTEDNFYLDPRGPNKLSYECKLCRSQRNKRWREQNRLAHNELVRNWSRKHPDKIRANALKYKYGLSVEDYNNLLIKQGGKCLLCGAIHPGDREQFSVDHCHVTGNIRGLLCTKCNRGLGCFNDSPELLHKAAVYIESFGG